MVNKENKFQTDGNEITDSEPVEKELEFLAKEIAYHDQLYYGEDAPEISDFEYDKLVVRNSELEARSPHLIREDSPSKRVGTPNIEKSIFGKIKHKNPMLSLNNGFREEDIADFVSRIRKYLLLGEKDELEFIAEPKIDGLSLSLRYEFGKLVQAATRGDGMVGEDVTLNILEVDPVPKKLTGNFLDFFEVRGELYMEKEDFFSLNSRQSKVGAKIFANPRNAAAGSLRQKNALVTKGRKLKFFAYSGGQKHPELPKTQWEFLTLLREFGFSVNNLSQRCKTVDELISYHKSIVERRGSLSYDVDGVVYKVDRHDYQNRLGQVARAPRWAIAHKFPAEKAVTIVQNIDIQVGRTGALTPVARLRPIQISGVMISNASLHNEDEIRRKDVRIGDHVLIQRAGDVIPQILKVITEERSGTEETFEFPKNCPICGAPTTRSESEAVRRCIAGFECSAQLIEGLKHFVSRDAFDIEGLGARQIEQLTRLGLIKKPADIFQLELHRDRLTSIEGYGVISINNLLRSIEARRTISLDRLIYAIGIPHVGQATAKLLARHYGSLEKMLHELKPTSDPITTQQKLTEINQIGFTMAKDIISFFGDSRNFKIITELIIHLTILPLPKRDFESPISGKTIVFTGTLSLMSRAEAKTKAEALGAQVASAVTKKTNFLISGSNSGSKVQKARALGIQIFTEEKWLDLINKKESL